MHHNSHAKFGTNWFRSARRVGKADSITPDGGDPHQGESNDSEKEAQL